MYLAVALEKQGKAPKSLDMLLCVNSQHLNCETKIRYFRKPCDRDPPKDNFKNFKFFKNSLKILSVYFWRKNVYFWGDNVYFGEITFTIGEITFTFGEITFTFWVIGVFRVFGVFFFLLGRFGTPWVRGPRRGFRKHLNRRLSPILADIEPILRPTNFSRYYAYLSRFYATSG